MQNNSREHMKQDVLLKVSPDIHDYENYLARFGVFMTKNIAKETILCYLWSVFIIVQFYAITQKYERI